MRHCLRKHQLCLHTCAHLSWLAGAQPSLNIFSSCPHLIEAHQLFSLCGSFYLALILPTYAEYWDKQPTVMCCICVFVAHFSHGASPVFLSMTTQFAVSETSFMLSGVMPRYIHHALLNAPFLVCLVQMKDLASFLPLKHYSYIKNKTSPLDTLCIREVQTGRCFIEANGFSTSCILLPVRVSGVSFFTFAFMSANFSCQVVLEAIRKGEEKR